VESKVCIKLRPSRCFHSVDKDFNKMGMTLSELESAILRQIASAPKNKHLAIEDHLPFLSVRSRDLTGVGMYVYFEDDSPSEILSDDLSLESIFSSLHILEMESLRYGLGYALSAENGRLKFLELFTYGDEL